MSITTENGLYFIDKDYKILYFNDAAKAMYPEIEIGQECYRTLACAANPCPHCPLRGVGKQNAFYNSARREWIEARAAEAQLPGIGACYSIMFTRTAEDVPNAVPDTASRDRHSFISALGSDDRTGMIGGYCEDGFPLFFANEKMIQMLGYDDYDDFYSGIRGLVGNTIHPDDMAQVVADIGPTYYEGLEYETVYRMPRKDGSWFWTYDKGRVVKVEDGRLAIVSNCTDITDTVRQQKDLEDQNAILQQHNRLMEFINDGMPGGYHRCGVTEGYPFLYVSKKFLQLVGYTRDELRQEFDDKFINLIHPDDRVFLTDTTEKTITGELDSEIGLSYRIKTKNGYLQVLDTSRMSEYNGERFFQGVIVDISKDEQMREHMESLKVVQKSLEDALKRETLYRYKLDNLQHEILDVISCGVFAYSLPDRNLLAINDTAKEIIGCGADEDPVAAFKEFLLEKIVPEDRCRVVHIGEALKKNGDTLLQDYRAIVNGQLIYIHSNIKHLENADGQSYILATIQDVTDLEGQNRQISNYLAMQEQMAESLGNGVYAYTLPEYEVLILNQEARRMFASIGADEAKQGRDITTRIYAEDMAALRGEIAKLKQPGDATAYTFRADDVSGFTRTFNCNTKLLNFADGHKYIISSISDITESMLTEKRLEEERSRYRDALIFGCSGVFAIDLTCGMIDETIVIEKDMPLDNKLHISLPIAYDAFASVWLSDDRIVSTSKQIDLIRSREALIEAYESGKTILDLEYYVAAEGKFYRLLILLYKRNDHIFASCIIYDITDARSDARMRRAVIDSLGEIYTALYHFSLRDKVCTLLKVNKDVSDHFAEQCDFDAFRLAYPEQYVEEEYREAVAKFLDPTSIKEALSKSNTVSIEFRRVDLGWCRVDLVAAERNQRGEVTAVVFAGAVINEQKQRDFAQQEALLAAYESANVANEAKTNFLASMSHDIRTPMNAIIGMTAIAGTHLDDKERLSDCLSKISLSSKHLLGIINDVLDMSKIESGKIELHEEEFNVVDLIENLVALSKAEADARGHELSVFVREIKHENLIGDSQRLQQVFMNLVSNAVKYTPEGGKIKLSISEKPSNLQQVGCFEFVIEDNGIGMSEEFLQHIFEPFSRAADDIRVSEIQGTGLGMAITKNIVQIMGGDIKVESKLNVGTTFTVTFFMNVKSANDAVDYEKFIGLPILVADDDADSCAYTCKLLQELGMKGEWVLSGKDAVEKTAQHHQDGTDYFAVVLDWKMPGMDGVETTAEIRRRVGKDIPIIIISAYDWSDIELAARAAGANAFISKPMFKSRVVHVFNELMGTPQKKLASELDDLSAAPFTGKRALLVEDNALNAEIAGEILGMAGFAVEFAVNGKEAVDRVANVQDGYYDIIFMDIQMPVMNGYEATRAIRSLPGDYVKAVPIFAMTANAFVEDISTAKSAGMNEHIAKPMDFAQLAQKLKKWLR